MLQLCDKGAILFADRYLPAHLHDLSADEATVASSADALPRSNRHILGPLIQGIILDNMADADPAMACRALLLLKYAPPTCLAPVSRPGVSHPLCLTPCVSPVCLACASSVS